MHSPHWVAISAECTSAVTQVATGAKALGSVTPHSPGSYYAAFFPLSIGYERMAKIALHVDSKIETGSFVPKKQMRDLGHNLLTLFDAVEEMALRRYSLDSDPYYLRPTDPVHAAISEILSEFAVSGRYNHLDRLGTGTTPETPESRWDAEVIMPIVNRHISTEKLAADKAIWDALGRDTRHIATASVRDVNGMHLLKLEEIAFRQRQYSRSNSWARMYALQLGRWLATILAELGFEAISTKQVPYLGEYFAWLRNDDRTLRSLKNPGKI